MAMTAQDPKTSGPPPPTVPNFREDERVLARYTSMLERRVKDFASEHDNSVRRNASAKRDELRDELEEANTEWSRRNEAFEAAREEYRKLYPDHVKKTRLVEPSGIENMKSLGKAKKLYTAAQEAWRAAENAASNSNVTTGATEQDLSDGGVVEIGDHSVKNIPLSQAPQQLKDPMNNNALQNVGH